MDWNQKLQSKSRMDKGRGMAAQFVLMSVAVCMVMLGIYRGEVSVVLNKAVNICLECIGLG